MEVSTHYNTGKEKPILLPVSDIETVEFQEMGSQNSIRLCKYNASFDSRASKKEKKKIASVILKTNVSTKTT